MNPIKLSTTLIAGCTLVGAAFAASQDRPKIAIIPLVNNSGEKWQALKDRQIEKATEFMTKEFAKRGFDLVPTPDVREAIAALQIDLLDEEQQKRATLFEIGKRVKADYVVFGVITHTEQKQFQRALYEDVEGRTDAKVWLLDVRQEKPILSAKLVTGRSGGNRPSIFKPSERQVQAAANAFRDALKPFFADHPVLKD